MSSSTNVFRKFFWLIFIRLWICWRNYCYCWTIYYYYCKCFFCSCLYLPWKRFPYCCYCCCFCCCASVCTILEWQDTTGSCNAGHWHSMLSFASFILTISPFYSASSLFWLLFFWHFMNRRNNTNTPHSAPHSVEATCVCACKVDSHCWIPESGFSANILRDPSLPCSTPFYPFGFFADISTATIVVRSINQSLWWAQLWLSFVEGSDTTGYKGDEPKPGGKSKANTSVSHHQLSQTPHFSL